MKVMQINAVSGILSTGRTTKELAVALQMQGHEASVVYSEGECDYSENYHMNNQLDKKIHAFLSRITGLVGYFSLLETRKLLKYIDKWQPDIVHLRNLHSNYICIPMLLKYLGNKNIATVVTLHDCFFFTGKCCHYTMSKCYSWENNCGNCPRVYMDNKSWFFDKTRKMQREKEKYFSGIRKLAIVGVSKWVSEEAKRSFIFKNSNNNISYIYNWIDLEKFRPRDNNLKMKLKVGNRKVVLGVSTFWDDTKGLSDFIAIANRMPDISFVLVGDFRKEDRLPENIITIGKTHNTDELANYYSMADIFFNPSVEETFGKVTAEALACGTPVIVYDTTACPELVGENCGKVVTLNDFGAVEMAIKELSAHTKEYYKNTCREFAVRSFDLKRNVRKYLDIYNALLYQ